jgi:hypothetical protein
LETTLKRASAIVVIGSIWLVAMMALPYVLFPKVEPTISFDDVDTGGFSGIGIRINYVIDDLETWETLWNDIHNTSTSVPETPFVNFTSEVVIAVFLGEFVTGGYLVQITRIIPSLTGFTVHVREEHPGPNCIVTMSITRPYHIVKAMIDSRQSIGFEYEIVIRNCL